MSHRQELLNVYDGDATVIGVRPRREAKASGMAVGAVNVLVVNGRGEVLLQRRPPDKENGGLWDKSVGGHVSAGEEFDVTAVREAAEELFDNGASPRVRLAASDDDFAALLAAVDLRECVVLRRMSLQKNLRDVRHAPRHRGVRNVLYHVAIYAGRTEIPRESFSPQASEVDELRFFRAFELDRLLLRGRLAPNMAFLWLTQGHALLQLGSQRGR